MTSSGKSSFFRFNFFAPIEVMHALGYIDSAQFLAHYVAHIIFSTCEANGGGHLGEYGHGLVPISSMLPELIKFDVQ